MRTDIQPPIPDHGDVWVRFYAEQGYSDAESQILARQICGGYGQKHRISVDAACEFRSSRKNARDRESPVIERLSLKDIQCAISRSL